MNIKTIKIDQSIIDKVMIDTYGSLEQAEIEMKEEEKLWCSCGGEDEYGDDYGAYYVPDNSHPEISKHHWRCKNCKKIVQIG